MPSKGKMQRKTPRHIRDKPLQIKDKTRKVATENYTSQKIIEWHESAEWKEIIVNESRFIYPEKL